MNKELIEAVCRIEPVMRTPTKKKMDNRLAKAFSITKLSMTTLSIATLSIITLSITALVIRTLNIKTQGITKLSMKTFT
jgi:hypothetical protein